jgi:AraC-like DNA-binding protein
LLGIRLASGGGLVYVAGRESGASLYLAESCKKEIGFLQTYVEVGNAEAFAQKLGGIHQQIVRVFDTSQDTGRELALRLNLLFLSYQNRSRALEGEGGAGTSGPSGTSGTSGPAGPAGTSGMSGPAGPAGRLPEMDGLWPMALYRALGAEIFQNQQSSGQSMARDSIQRVKDYIGGNLGGDVSLSKLASVAHFNPKYLSKLFGEQEGVNLSDYIADKRLDLAKALLAEGKKMQEIAGAVGFLSASYFTRFFKKATNMTPNQYREYVYAKEADKR